MFNTDIIEWVVIKINSGCTSLKQVDEALQPYRSGVSGSTSLKHKFISRCSPIDRGLGRGIWQIISANICQHFFDLGYSKFIRCITSTATILQNTEGKEATKIVEEASQSLDKEDDQEAAGMLRRRAQRAGSDKENTVPAPAIDIDAEAEDADNPESQTQ